jgi:hypothetical protein
MQVHTIVNGKKIPIRLTTQFLENKSKDRIIKDLKDYAHDVHRGGDLFINNKPVTTIGKLNFLLKKLSIR